MEVTLWILERREDDCLEYAAYPRLVLVFLAHAMMLTHGPSAVSRLTKRNFFGLWVISAIVDATWLESLNLMTP